MAFRCHLAVLQYSSIYLYYADYIYTLGNSIQLAKFPSWIIPSSSNSKAEFNFSSLFQRDKKNKKRKKIIKTAAMVWNARSWTPTDKIFFFLVFTIWKQKALILHSVIKMHNVTIFSMDVIWNLTFSTQTSFALHMITINK